MSKQLTSILRRVFLGALATLTASNSTVAVEVPPDTAYSPDQLDSSESQLRSQPNLQKKLILRQVGSGQWDTFSHRSHRSHQSHRSHYSSTSGSSSGSSSSGSGSSGSGSSGSNQSRSTESGVTPQPLFSSPKALATVKLGSRVLRKGMRGTDVTELINLLLKKGYLYLEDDTKSLSGVQLFDVEVENAVKQFQTDSSLKADGIVGPPVIYRLKK
jgi:hypothetical protein